MAGKKAPRLEGTEPRGTKGRELRTDAGGPQRSESHSDGSSVAEAVRRIGLHNHLCVIYETQEERFAAAVPFLQAGLERGEKCLYIASDDNAASGVLEATRAQGVNVEAAIKSGTLTVNTENEPYLKRGYFEPEGTISFLAESVSAAKAAGYSAFRLAGEVTWMPGADGGERWAEYESKLNHFLRDYDASAICLYDHRRSSPEVILGVIRTHPTVVYGGLVSKNPYYVPPEEFLQPNQPALEVQRLLSRLLDYKRAEEALRQLSARLLLAQEEERRRIARELHDATAQSLAALAINLGVVQESSPGLKSKARKALADSFALVEKCIGEIRTISYLMHPPMLEELGLRSALRWYTKGFTKRSGIRVKLEMPRKLGDVSNDVALALYRIVQESLTNIHRHSGSRTATLRLVREPRRIIMSVADQGRGMKTEVVDNAWGEAGPAESAHGVGIQGMRERVRQLGGQLQVQSSQKGTTVTVVLPLREESRAGHGDDRVS